MATNVVEQSKLDKFTFYHYPASLPARLKMSNLGMGWDWGWVIVTLGADPLHCFEGALLSWDLVDLDALSSWREWSQP